MWIFIFCACHFQDNLIVALRALRVLCDGDHLKEDTAFLKVLVRYTFLHLCSLLPHHFRPLLHHLISLLILICIFFVASNHAVLY